MIDCHPDAVVQIGFPQSGRGHHDRIVADARLFA
jgi:hypothetical protein